MKKRTETRREKDEEGSRPDRGTESDRHDEVDTDDEQYQSFSVGNRDAGNHNELEHYEEFARDRDVPYFNVKLTDMFHEILTDDEMKGIEELYKKTDDEKVRINYLMDLFSIDKGNLRF